MNYLFISFIVFLPFQGIAQETIDRKTSSLPLEAQDAGSARIQKWDLQSLIEPPMPLSQELPMNLSYANKKNYIQNPKLLEEEAKNNVAVLKSKAFPWLFLTAAFVVGLTLILIRSLPSKFFEEKTHLVTKEKMEEEFKKELKKMTLPKNSKETEAFIIHLDFLLRQYLENTYEFPAFTYTKEELIARINPLEKLNSSMKEGMAHTFKLADQMKFGNIFPNPKDCQNILLLFQAKNPFFEIK